MSLFSTMCDVLWIWWSKKKCPFCYLRFYSFLFCFFFWCKVLTPKKISSAMINCLWLNWIISRGFLSVYFHMEKNVKFLVSVFYFILFIWSLLASRIFKFWFIFLRIRNICMSLWNKDRDTRNIIKFAGNNVLVKNQLFVMIQVYIWCDVLGCEWVFDRFEKKEKKKPKIRFLRISSFFMSNFGPKLILILTRIEWNLRSN